MRPWIKVLLCTALAVSLGCGDSKTVNTAPLTDEQKREIQEKDMQIDDEESGGRGGKLGGKAKAKKN